MEALLVPLLPCLSHLPLGRLLIQSGSNARRFLVEEFTPDPGLSAQVWGFMVGRREGVDLLEESCCSLPSGCLQPQNLMCQQLLMCESPMLLKIKI